jgi:hypothetical protein
MNRPLTALGVLLALGLPASAGAATPASLPTVVRTLAATGSVKRDCAQAPDRVARGLAVSRYRAPMAGYVTATLTGRSTSDWDLLAVDHATGRRLGASQAFGSREVVQSWAGAGQSIDFVACRRTGTARHARLAVHFFDVAPPKAGAKVSVVRVRATGSVLDALEARGLDVTESRGPGWADVLVAGAGQLAVIDQLGLGHTTRIADLDAYAARSRRADARYAVRVGAAGSALPSGRTTYRSYEEVQADLKKLVEDHPGLVRPVTIGTTFQGREIQGVEIARDVNAEDGRPTFFLMGEHHAREWPSEEIAVEYATLLADDSGDPRLDALLANERTTIVPVVNVDGFVSTHDMSAIDPNDNLGPDPNIELGESVAPPGGILAYRRKNCDGAVPNGSFPCELQWGVDNNRNYGNLWGGPGASQDPTSQSYHGPGPRSEPETQAVWNYARTHNVTGLISLHTIAALVLRPPGLHTGGLSPDEAAMKDLGDRMAATTGYTSEYGWQLYDTAGTTEDDTYAATGGYGYTIEIGPSGGLFHMPYETGVVQQWVKGDTHGVGGMREALLLMGESVADAHQHAVISGQAPAGATLRLARSFDTLTSPWCAMGLDPVVTVAAVPAPLACPQGVQDPITLKDSLDTTMTVPGDGAFAWHVNQSTRPFVGGGATIRELSTTPSREETFTGGGPDPQANTPTQGSQDREYTIGPDEAPDVVKIVVSWDTPEDYDLEVYRKNADGTLTQIGSSGNNPGEAESVELSGDQVTPGTYVVRVVNFAAAVGTWTAKVGLYSATETVTTGHPEPYTMTCEVGGAVVQSRQVYIARGETLSLDPCSSAAPAVVHPGADGAPVAGPPVAGASVGKAKARKLTRAHVRRAQRSCLKARRAVHGTRGRAKGLAKYRAKRSCAKAARLARQYRRAHPRH